MDLDRPGRTRTVPYGPGRTQTDPEGPGRSQTDPDPWEIDSIEDDFLEYKDRVVRGLEFTIRV